jgi:ATP-dependent helicase/nuclease subunit A
MSRGARAPRDQLDLWSTVGAAIATDATGIEARPRGTPSAAPSRAEAPMLPDAAARRRIATALDTNLFVEAGAGAGKTTEMVSRMVALVRSGVRVEQVAAVTFTRKAAAELRERFQTVLERELRAAHRDGDALAAERLDRALRGMDTAFLGTIHSFCARLLRERPLDAGLDPHFREVQPPDDTRIRREFWTAYLERLAASGDDSLVALARVGLEPASLFELFTRLAENADVAFPADAVPAPAAADARRALEALLDRAQEIMPPNEPAGGWDPLQTLVRRLRFHRFILGWDDDVRFLNVLAEACSSAILVRQTRWARDKRGQKAASELGNTFRVFLGQDGDGGRAARAWYAHRYPIALAFAGHASTEFAAYRRISGQLFFQDLLLLSARLLRDSPAARRELGRRYRHLLVDEFQDTDPIQAEVLFLLASEPPAHGTAERWLDASPRPGALFVVGDPKQSIYRFRRADITLYDQVKRRFRVFGDVLELTANFRSRRPIEEFVNGVFAAVFPEEPTPEQAPFAPMRVQREDVAHQGVLSYRLDLPPKSSWEVLAEEEAERIASWVARRIEAGERTAGDFLLLTRRKKFLSRYARALEARNIPVQVTGAGLGIEMELDELRLLLRALCDPGDPTLTTAVLVGLFFGIDYEELAQHVLDRGGWIGFVHVADTPATRVEEALALLHEFWRLSQQESADIVVARIVDRLGLLPFAAAGELGESRAGALLYILDAVRKAALNGNASLAGALAAIEAALESEEAEAPLEPGRRNVVRLMNLHQAKGLEAPVVILAEPFGRNQREPVLHIARDAAGSAIGRTLVGRKVGYRTDVFARPAEWEAFAAAETRFEQAEEDRLRYVAATRAGEELVIGRGPVEAESPWSPFGPWLDRHADRLILPDVRPPARARLEKTPSDIEAEIRDAERQRRALAVPTYRAASVTTRVKADDGDGGRPNVAAVDRVETRPAEATGAGGVDLSSAEFAYAVAPAADLPAGRGPEWGTAVHGALEAAARGVPTDDLRSVCRSLLVAAERPIGEDGEPEELAELLETVRAVHGSPLWERARAARAVHVEVPFAVTLPLAEYRTMTAAAADDAAPLQIVEGIIDLAFLEDDGWCLVDYKSDTAGLAIPPELRERYHAQVALYAAAWSRLTGAAVHERAILFTATGEISTF